MRKVNDTGVDVKVLSPKQTWQYLYIWTGEEADRSYCSQHQQVVTEKII